MYDPPGRVLPIGRKLGARGLQGRPSPPTATCSRTRRPRTRQTSPAKCIDLPRLVSLRRDGFDLDFDTRTGKLLDDQKRGGRIMIAHGSPAYAEIIVQDRLVCDVDSEFYNVLECHVGRGENCADALEDHLNLLRRVFRYRTVQARTNLSIAEQDPSVRGNFRAVRSIVGMGANSIVERMDRQHRRIPPWRSD